MSFNFDNLSRDEYIYLAKLYERAERFDQMMKAIQKFVELNPVLDLEERNILSAGYKNIISGRRSSWRVVNGLERKDEKKNATNITYLKQVKNKIENEMREISDEIQSNLDKFLIPNVQDVENEVFYWKLKGDYYRYLCEFTEEDEFTKSCDNAEKAYRKAYDIARDQIPISSSTRLGLALNFSVFYFEIKGDREEACEMARENFDQAIKVLDDLEKNKSKDTILIIQLLKENLNLWSAEIEEEEEN